jgi:hypothetical protein
MKVTKRRERGTDRVGERAGAGSLKAAGPLRSPAEADTGVTERVRMADQGVLLVPSHPYSAWTDLACRAKTVTCR